MNLSDWLVLHFRVEELAQPTEELLKAKVRMILFEQLLLRFIRLSLSSASQWRIH